MATRGMAWLGWVRIGRVVLGSLRRCMAWWSSVWHGIAGRGFVRHGSARYGMDRSVPARLGEVRLGLHRRGWIWLVSN